MPKIYKTLILFFYISAHGQVSPGTSIISASSVVCTGQAAAFTVTTSLVPTSYLWSVFPTKDVTLTATDSPTFTAIFPKDLTYTVSVRISTPDMDVTTTKRVPVSRTPKTSFNASFTNAGFPRDLVLTNYSSYSQQNYWQYSDVTELDSSLHTVKYYSAPGNYSVTLFSIGARGCSSSNSYTFQIDSASSLTLPNVFTPNRDDVNDVFKPISTGISTLSGWIFSREGVLLHHWTTVNGYWDGRTTSGELCVAGQYIAIVEAVGFDGKSYKLSGHVTLIR